MNTAWIVMPVLLPLLLAPLLLLCERWCPRGQWALSLAGTVALLAVACMLAAGADSGDTRAYLLGNWPAPFGIVLVLDRLAALLLVLTALVALASLLASSTLARRGPHFFAVFQVQLAGLNGAFLTGDLFNLFVFFEVLLGASYALLLHDARGRALRAGVHYIVINLVGSALFLVAASLLYGITGTLNFADMAVRLAQLPATEAGLAQAAAMLLLVVFGIKAAVVPLGFWLPGTYAEAPGPVAALFAIMTKVGLYGIVRVCMLLFGAGTDAFTGWGAGAMFALGIVTTLFGALSALAAPRLAALIGGLVLVSSGTLVAAFTLGTDVLAGALYYLVHSTLAIALLFLLAHAIGMQRGTAGDRFIGGPVVAQPLLLGLIFIIAAGAAAGLPPMAGFVGKAWMLSSSVNAPSAAWFWMTLLGSSLFALLALARAGSRVFWNVDATVASGGPAVPAPVSGIAVLLVASMLWMAFAVPAARYTTATAMQLAQPRGYIDAVLQARPVPAPPRTH